MNTTNPNYEWLSRKTLNHTLSRGRAGGINPVPKALGNLLVRRGLALARILEIPILAFINFLPDATVRPRGGEHAGAQSALTPELTFDRAVAGVRCAAARCGQNPPERLPGGRLGKWMLALTEFDLHYVPSKAVKGQVIADFLVQSQENTND
ncbi:hypothetical protein PIB30_072858 [Stylosanthes scabra]|uniref:Uncharacterized protein n=1 Tax=Stylosanthes scabra TaxID=79078 RepID=A0ABU6ZMT7_9FABA|nr:hypothetical protein [Stylosanthes scabra]